MNTVTYSHSGNATARIFLLKPLIQAQPLSVIITESHQDLYLLRNFASSVWGRSVKELLRLGDILSLETPVEGVFFCHPDIFRSEGNLYEVQKRNSIAIMRGDTHPLEYWIDTLLAAGYTHDEHLDTTFSYKKE